LPAPPPVTPINRWLSKFFEENSMGAERKYEPVKESRGWYFVEYYPPINGARFATLSLVITENASPIKIVAAME
jgi:hypothetical protein